MKKKRNEYTVVSVSQVELLWLRLNTGYVCVCVWVGGWCLCGCVCVCVWCGGGGVHAEAEGFQAGSFMASAHWSW